jgi:hypothetical protein
MENLLRIEQYGYMRGLNRLRNFLVSTQYDLSRRDWISKTIDEHGYIKIQPDTYSPKMLEDILRYALTLDEKERLASEAKGLSRPRFRLVDEDSLVAIDALWSLNGIHRPFHALNIWRDVVFFGRHEEILDVPPFPRIPLPGPRYLHVGQEWETDQDYSGLRDPLMEAVGTEGCGFATKTLKNGNVVLDIGQEDPFTVNVEGLRFLFNYEVDRLIKEHHDNPYSGYPSAYLWYAQTGMISVHKSQLSRIDRILRRTTFKERMGLNGAPDVAGLMEQTVAARAGVDPVPSVPHYPLFDGIAA